MSDFKKFKEIEDRLFTAVIGDVLDVLGYRNQFLPQPIKPLVPGKKLIGRAMTVLEADYPAGSGRGPLSDRPFGLLFEALDDLKEGEIYIATGASFDYALWGGLMTTRATYLKAAGAILNGFIRDCDEIKSLEFSVFSRGSYAQDQGVRGKVVDYRVPISIEGVLVHSGDLIVADDEGVIIIPAQVEDEAIAAALEKVSTENEVAKAIRQGMSTTEAFETFGVM
ncbi:RraA family protein [Falsihalocynthiibacter arcticus]|uniref:Dimethylmenaquinone methyltransferase n=1 Tax=Falsihalocynthiibacter arcticus TaxID=1579316 RepID=A0A126V131_9RHOB|nr:RraA family protein [Falsihalocynthiibacter arcticus]AML52038.1 dimethylmenaquinone methyltransferase [Falsihalocynthiibacter arcticus]